MDGLINLFYMASQSFFSWRLCGGGHVTGHKQSSLVQNDAVNTKLFSD